MAIRGAESHRFLGTEMEKEQEMENYIFQLYALIGLDFSGLSLQDGRRALIYLLGNNNKAIVAADILIYLIYQTYTTPQDLLEQYNGFIVRPYQQIELYTGCSNLIKHKDIIELLKNEGLIETHNKSIKGKTCFKVNTEVLIQKLDEAYMAIGKMRDDYWEKYRNNKKQGNKPIAYKDRIDWSLMNGYLEEGENGVPKGYDFLLQKGFKLFDIQMAYYVSKFWKETYGTDYEWSEAEFNTLSKNLTSGGVTGVDIKELREAIQTLEEVDWLTKAYTARKIIFRMRGYKRFKK